MSVPAEWLRDLYLRHHGDAFFVLVRPGAILLCEGPQDKQKESLVRLFLSAHAAEMYADWHRDHDARVQRVTLVGLFNLLPRINALSMKKYNVPVRVEVTTIDAEGTPRSIDTLHSIYELLS